MKHASHPYEFYYSCHIWAQGASFEVPILLKPYLKFVESPLKSFFKSLFLGTKLGQALRIMSASKAVLKGLTNQECEKGNWKKHPPIPYMPIIDEVQEAIVKGKEYLQD